MNEYELEQPIRIAAIIAAYDAIKPDETLIMLAINSIDHTDLHAYDAFDDRDKTIMLLINALTGSDDDHDDFIHDLSHALNDLEPCDEHPHINCATCCDLDHA